MWKQLWNTLAGQADRHRALGAFAADKGLVFTPGVGAHYTMVGEAPGPVLRIVCAEPSRGFVRGLELSARAELGMALPGSVVLMGQHLKQQLEQQSHTLYEQYTDNLQTTQDPLPEELRWLAMYRKLAWAGPPPSFWRRFVVLGDQPEQARQWLDAECLQPLLALPVSRDDEPLLLMQQGGNRYLRMQLPARGDAVREVEALELFWAASRYPAKTAPPR